MVNLPSEEKKINKEYGKINLWSKKNKKMLNKRRFGNIDLWNNKNTERESVEVRWFHSCLIDQRG